MVWRAQEEQTRLLVLFFLKPFKKSSVLLIKAVHLFIEPEVFKPVVGFSDCIRSLFLGWIIFGISSGMGDTDSHIIPCFYLLEWQFPRWGKANVEGIKPTGDGFWVCVLTSNLLALPPTMISSHLLGVCKWKAFLACWQQSSAFWAALL